MQQQPLMQVATPAPESTFQKYKIPIIAAIVVAVIVVIIIIILAVVLTRKDDEPAPESKADSEASAPAPEVKKPFEITDENKNFVVEVCNSCGGPSEGVGAGAGRYEVILTKGEYTGEELAKLVTDKLNAVFKQRQPSLPAKDWEIKFDKDVGNFLMRNIGKRAWWLKEDGAGAKNPYELMKLTDIIHRPGGNWAWLGGTVAGGVAVERMTPKRERYITLKDLALMNN